MDGVYRLDEDVDPVDGREEDAIGVETCSGERPSRWVCECVRAMAGEGSAMGVEAGVEAVVGGKDDEADDDDDEPDEGANRIAYRSSIALAQVTNVNGSELGFDFETNLRWSRRDVSDWRRAATKETRAGRGQLGVIDLRAKMSLETDLRVTEYD